MFNRGFIRRWFLPAYRRLVSPRWRELLGQMRRRAVSESDIHLFGMLDGLNGLVVDAGANRGQFALSLMAVNRSLRVLSFEANSSLRSVLLAVWSRHPLRFRFRLLGLGEDHQRLLLRVPRAQAVDLSSNASLDPAEFERPLVRERLSDYTHAEGGQYDFEERTVELVPLDALNLSPLAIKIDVEGWELAVLKGMASTLRRSYPLLMLELNQPERFMPWLAQLGYQFFAFDAEQRRLTQQRLIEGRLNVFALHPDSPVSVRRRLEPLMEFGQCKPSF